MFFHYYNGSVFKVMDDNLSVGRGGSVAVDSMIICDANGVTVGMDLSFNQYCHVRPDGLVIFDNGGVGPGFTSKNVFFGGVVVGADGGTSNSMDGRPITSAIAGYNLGIAASQSACIITGASGNYAITYDAKTFEGKNVGFTANDLNAIAHNGDAFVVGGDGGVVGISYDGINWTQVTTGFADDILCAEVSRFVQ